MSFRHEAIRAIYPQTNLIDDGHGAFDADGIQVQIDETLVAAKTTELQDQYNSKQYQRDRAVAYPSWQDQLDNIFHNGIDAWKADIQAIKDQFPKP